jgi:hypothetical protein
MMKIGVLERFGGEEYLQGENKKVVDKGNWRGEAGVQR